jgi:hypothetical protein
LNDIVLDFWQQVSFTKLNKPFDDLVDILLLQDATDHFETQQKPFSVIIDAEIRYQKIFNAHIPVTKTEEITLLVQDDSLLHPSKWNSNADTLSSVPSSQRCTNNSSKPCRGLHSVCEDMNSQLGQIRTPSWLQGAKDAHSRSSFIDRCFAWLSEASECTESLN